MTAPVVVIHAGAGDRGIGPAGDDDARHRALVEALECARACLERGGDAIEAAHDAVVSMEAFELFNAGRGSVLCADGTVEMSAALMRGSDREPPATSSRCSNTGCDCRTRPSALSTTSASSAVAAD